jgi:Domain of unknown function (DUF4386)
VPDVGFSGTSSHYLKADNGYLICRPGLVPRRMAWFGLIGGPLLLIGQLGVLFDLWDAGSAVLVLVAPEAFWELFVGFY